MLRTTGLLLGSLIGVVGCAAVSAKMVSPDTALISASDYEASVPQARKAALVAAAKMARQRGYEYFSVVAARDTAGMDWRYSSAGPISFNHRSPSGGPVVEAGQDLMVRFLHASKLPAERDSVYSVAAVLAGR
jgi:hypothetical protein